MSSGVLDLKTRRKVSLAAAVAGVDPDSAEVSWRDAGAAAAINGQNTKQQNAAGASRTQLVKDALIALLDAGDAYLRFMTPQGAGPAAKRPRFYQRSGVRKAKSHARLFGLEMAQRDRQRVR